jgi:hypothetical protein
MRIEATSLLYPELTVDLATLESRLLPEDLDLESSALTIGARNN